MLLNALVKLLASVGFITSEAAAQILGYNKRGDHGEHITNARKYLADQKCTQIDFHLKGQHGRVKQFWLKSEVEKIAARRATKKQLTISFSSNDRIAKLEQEIEKLRSTILHMDRDA